MDAAIQDSLRMSGLNSSRHRQPAVMRVSSKTGATGGGGSGASSQGSASHRTPRASATRGVAAAGATDSPRSLRSLSPRASPVAAGRPAISDGLNGGPEAGVLGAPGSGSPGGASLLAIQREYAKQCANHSGVAIDQSVMDGLSTKQLEVHLDQYSSNDLKVFFFIMKKASQFKSLAFMLGQATVDYCTWAVA